MRPERCIDYCQMRSRPRNPCPFIVSVGQRPAAKKKLVAAKKKLVCDQMTLSSDQIDLGRRPDRPNKNWSAAETGR